MPDLMTALRNADAAGDTEAANRIAAMIREQQDQGGSIQAPQEVVASTNNEGVPTVENMAIEQARSDAMPERTTGEVIGGLGEAALTLATGATGGAIGFLAGAVPDIIDQLAGNPDQKRRELFSTALTNMPEGEAGQEYIKSLGEVLGVLPPVGLAGGYTPKLNITKVPISSKNIAKQKEFVSKGYEPKSFNRNKIFSESAKKKQLDEVLASGNQERLAAMIEADPDFFKALDELGAKEKGLPSAASKNRQYQETEQALKKMPGSDLSKKEFDQVAELQKISDDLITEFKGNIDKSELSMSLANDANRVIENLNLTADAAYNGIKENIPKQALASTDNIGSMVMSELKNSGGDLSQLSPLEKRLLNMHKSGKSTYHAMDKIRKQVGEQLNRKGSPFKDESTGALKRIYSALTKDQELTLSKKDFDLGSKFNRVTMTREKQLTPVKKGTLEAWKGAKDLVVQRKALEDKSIQMFGKNLSDAFMPKIGLAMKKLTTGDYKKFSELMDAVPEGRKQEVIVSALNDVFTMGSRKEKQLNVAGYADWYNGLSKNAKLKKELYSHLPKKLTNKLDALGKVTNGIRNAQSAAPVGGQIMASAGVLDKVVNGIAKRFLSKLPGIIGDLVSVGLEKSKGKGLDAAIDVLNDPDFIANINAIAKGQIKKADMLEKRLMNKGKFRVFVNSLPANEARAISVLGLTSWLARSNEQQDTKANTYRTSTKQ